MLCAFFVHVSTPLTSVVLVSCRREVLATWHPLHALLVVPREVTSSPIRVSARADVHCVGWIELPALMAAALAHLADAACMAVACLAACGNTYQQQQRLDPSVIFRQVVSDTLDQLSPSQRDPVCKVTPSRFKWFVLVLCAWCVFVAATEAEPSYDCKPRNSCPELPGMDSINNFMQYTDDVCMDAFTPGQFSRVLRSWQAWRAGK